MQNAKSFALCIAIALGAYLVGRSTLDAQQVVPPLHQQPNPTVIADVRKPISTLPFMVTECGSYFLTACLTGVAGQDGITITADNVTIDLNGFALEGTPGSLSGIVVPGPNTNIAIKNGTVSSWGVHGISIENVPCAEIENVLCSENGDMGINASSGTVRVSACTIAGNLGTGIDAGSASLVTECIVKSNGGDGIVIAVGSTGGTIVHCTISSHSADGSTGIHAEQALIVECDLYENWRGIFGGFGSNIIDCNVSRAGSIGVELNDKCRVTGTNCTGLSEGIGFLVAGTGPDNLIDGCRASFFATGYEIAGNRNMLVRNMSSRNTTHYSVSAGNAFGVVIDVTSTPSFSNTDPTANFIY